MPLFETEYKCEFCTQFVFHVNKSHFHKNDFALRRFETEAQGNSEMAYYKMIFEIYPKTIRLLSDKGHRMIKVAP